MIPYARQDINDADIEEVVRALRSDWLTQGPAIERFEREVANFCGVQHAVALSSGTAALHLVCQALGLGRGDRLWTSPITFVASANCALYCGASVDFVDIDPRTYNLSVSCLEKKLRQAAQENTLPKIVIPVHLAGQSCEMERIFELSQRYGFKIVEDASHAIGGAYRNEPVGCCRFSHAAVFSFHPVKIITTGEGGMAVSNDHELGKKVARLRTHGITRHEEEMAGAPHGPWYYEQLELGYNYRMTDIQAALGWSQMKRINTFVERRQALAARYNRLLAALPLVLPHQHKDTSSSFHLYVIRLRLDQISKTHRQIFEELRAKGIGVNLHYIPVYRQPYYRQLGFAEGLCPEAEKYYNEAISLPMFYNLKESEQDQVATALREILS
ncbi:MAG: UDP-4-amino-4,6-dideoxy-N-acetyl-beta-L-altrosamine transaminase [bacterium]